jgi:Aspartyl protease
MMKKLCVGLLSMCAVTTAYGKDLASKPITIGLEPYLGTALAMRFDVNGHEGLFLFDTGGGVSIISPEFAKTIGCTPWGRVTGFRMTGERMDLQRCEGLHFTTGKVHLEAPTAGIVDLEKLLPKDAPHLDGSVGLDIFAGKTITFDESGQTLTLETPASLQARIQGAKEVPIRLVRDVGGLALTVEVGVPTAYGTAWMEMDSGNEGPLVVANHLANLFHLDPEAKGPQTVKFELGGGIPVEEHARTSDLIMDGNIGAHFFTKWVLTVDLAAGRAWLSPSLPNSKPLGS